MRAIRQHELGAPDVLQMEDVPDPEPGPGRVRIAVEAIGVHLVDTSIRRGEFFQPTELPSTPGREVAGVVDRVGPDVDESMVGRRVVTHLGLGGGGYAELAVADAAVLHEVPAVLTPQIAVACIGTGRTAAGVLRLTPIGSDDVVVVTAATGGLGALVVREARHQGAWVLALAGGPDKIAVAGRLGADAVVDSRDPHVIGLVEKSLDGRRPTRVYDGVGGVLATGLHGLLTDDGVLTSYTGLSAADFDGPAEVRSLLAPDWADRFGGIRMLETEALERAADGSRVPLVGRPFALSAAAAVHRALEERRTVGKVLLDPRR